MKTEITETEKKIKKLELDWQDSQVSRITFFFKFKLQQISDNDNISSQAEHDRAEILLEKAQEELRTASGGGTTKTSLKETLLSQINEQETLLQRLQTDKAYLLETRDQRSKQQEMWSDLIQLLQVKTKCFHDAMIKGPGGTLMVDQNAETFTLQ